MNKRIIIKKGEETELETINCDNTFLLCDKFHHNKFVTRSHLSNMMFSHIFMIIQIAVFNL